MKRFLIYLIFIICIVSFAIIPVTGDIKVFLGSANQSHFISSNLVIGSFKAWELKSVYNRLFIYAIYKIVKPFYVYGTRNFEIAVKALYCIFIVILNHISILLLTNNNSSKTFDKSIIISMLFITSFTACHVQAEMTVAALSLLATALWINALKNRQCYIFKLMIVGLIIGSFAFFKSVLILLSVSIVSAMCLLSKKYKYKINFKDIILVAVFSFLFIFLTCVSIFFINTSEFDNILNAALYQNTLISGGFYPGLIKRVFWMSCKCLLYIPGVIFGLLISVFNIKSNIKTSELKIIFLRIMLWIVPLVFIVLSNQFFIYHYSVFIYCACIEIIIYWDSSQNKASKKWPEVFGIILLIFYLLSFSFFSSLSIEMMKKNIQSYKGFQEKMTAHNIKKDSDLLYLDSGLASYYFQNKSYSKYFFPLPVQRLGEDSDLSTVLNCVNDIYSYDGDYILLDEKWLFKNGNQKIKTYLFNKYDILDMLTFYSPSWTIKSGGQSLSEVLILKHK